MRAFLLAGLACAFVATAAAADPVADFYHGKTITILIGVGAGGEYDLQARLVGKYLGRYIPGNPTVVAQNMTGASGLKMTNYLASVAPHDGTYIGMVMNGLPALQAVGLEGVQFDAAKFNWLGAMAPVDETITIWHTAGVTTVDGARQKEVVTGATARGSITYTFPQMMNELFGTRFKLVTGYAGGNEINLAMERGEVEARNNTWSSWKATRPDWLRDKKISVIVQSGPRAPDLDAPLVRAALQQHRLDIYAAMPWTGSERLAEDVDFGRRCALIIGSEGRGVSTELRGIAEDVTIPTAGVESLNAAVAASVLLYETRRQRVREAVRV